MTNKCIRYSQLLAVIFSFVAFGFSKAEKDDAQLAKRDVQPSFENLYKVSDDLFRSEQPDRMNVVYLDSIGIKTILNLRQFTSDGRRLNSNGQAFYDVPINAWHMTYDELLTALIVIKKSAKPVLVHCKHGSDRTGVVVAAYRMTEQGWSKERAILEFQNKQFGYHSNLFPNLLRLLQYLDIDQLNKDLGE